VEIDGLTLAVCGDFRKMRVTNRIPDKIYNIMKDLKGGSRHGHYWKSNQDTKNEMGALHGNPGRFFGLAFL
jgi:hypothetical protein